jgi:antitoxin ChpS
MSEDMLIQEHRQKAEDGSGDIIIDLPLEIVDALNLQVGGVLIVEVVDGLVTLKPKRTGAVETDA